MKKTKQGRQPATKRVGEGSPPVFEGNEGSAGAIDAIVDATSDGPPSEGDPNHEGAGETELANVDASTEETEHSDSQGTDAESASDTDVVEAARPLPRAHLRGLLEALVFASDKPLSTKELSTLASAPIKLVKELLVELKGAFAHHGIALDEVAGGWLFRTHVQFAPFVRELTSERPVRLSRAQVETLAIAAYRQPITRPEIDEIRGVDSGATLKLLLERDLVRILGKKDEPGRPLLYGTTTQFLEFFGLKSLRDLPTLREFTELSDESRLVAEAELSTFAPETTLGVAPNADAARHDEEPNADAARHDEESNADAARHDEEPNADAGVEPVDRVPTGAQSSAGSE